MVYQSVIAMTPDIQRFLHAMHDKLPITDDQSMRHGSSGFIPLACKETPIQKLFYRMEPIINSVVNKDWKYVGVWSTRLVKDGFHVKHTHPKGKTSGIVYVDVPDNTSGELVFDDMVIAPNTGDFVMFPSETFHGVATYHGEKPRLTVAFDIFHA